MRKIRFHAFFYLLALIFPAMGKAREDLPRVQVVARVNGQIFNGISSSKLEELKRDVQTGVSKALEDSPSFRCMRWGAEGSGSGAKARAWLFVDLSQKNPDQELSWIDLSFSGKVGDSPPMLLWKTPSVAATWDRAWSNRRLTWLSDKVLRATAAEILKTELRQAFDSSFIASIPIADGITVNRPSQRIVVPIDAKQLSLEPETLLKLELVASLCPPKPKGGCRIGLWSDASRDGDLRCRLGKISCCPHQGWSSAVIDQLEARKPVTSALYLAGNHRHCQFGPDNCPGPDEIYRHPGS